MAQTTIPVRLLAGAHSTRRLAAAFKNILLSFILVSASILAGCGSSEDGGKLSINGGSGGGPSGGSSGGAVPTGAASAALAWDPVAGVSGYIIHYGIQSPNSPGSCAYAQSTFSTTPAATVTGLAEGTTYYFAVSAYNGLESACSGEVSTVTGSA
jgi:hypothetical protein